MLQTKNSQAIAAVRAGMDVKTARRYRRLGKLPSAVAVTHDWRTREDPFAEAWEEVRQELAVNPGLQAHTLLHRAGRLTRPRGVLTLTLNANAWLRQYMPRLLQAPQTSKAA